MARKIMVVDDEPKYLHFISELLTGAGYDVRGTADLLLVEAIAEEFGPDLLVCDLAMPGRDGLELAREPRSKGKTNTIPVMFLTARRASKLLWMIKSLLENPRTDKSTQGKA